MGKGEVVVFGVVIIVSLLMCILRYFDQSRRSKKTKTNRRFKPYLVSRLLVLEDFKRLIRKKER